MSRTRALRVSAERDVAYVARLIGAHTPEPMDDDPVRARVELVEHRPRPGRPPRGHRAHALVEELDGGFVRAGLGVDAGSITRANQLYEQAGMHVSARYDIYEETVA